MGSEGNKTLEIKDISVSLQIRKGQRYLRARIGSDGQPVISAPSRYPLHLIKKFAEDKYDWIVEHSFDTELIKDGTKLFSGHKILVSDESAQRNSIKVYEEVIMLKLTAPAIAASSQQYIRAKIYSLYNQLLRSYLEDRLDYYTEETGLEYGSLEVKHLRSKWGYCDRHKNLTFSSYLMSCEDDLIDYVVLHELVHTKHMNHSSDFWETVEHYMPDYKRRRKELKMKKMLLARV